MPSKVAQPQYLSGGCKQGANSQHSVQPRKLKCSGFLFHVAPLRRLQGRFLSCTFINTACLLLAGVRTPSDRLFGPAASSSSPLPIMQHAPPPAGQCELLKESISGTCALLPPALMRDTAIFAAAALLTDAAQPNICVASQLRSRRRRPLASCSTLTKRTTCTTRLLIFSWSVLLHNDSKHSSRQECLTTALRRMAKANRQPGPRHPYVAAI